MWVWVVFLGWVFFMASLLFTKNQWLMCQNIDAHIFNQFIIQSKFDNHKNVQMISALMPGPPFVFGAFFWLNNKLIIQALLIQVKSTLVHLEYLETHIFLCLFTCSYYFKFSQSFNEINEYMKWYFCLKFSNFFSSFLIFMIPENMYFLLFCRFFA